MQQHLPRYRQIINYYADQIDSGKLVEGEQMPTEGEICALFSVSRITVRQALDELSRTGRIAKVQGRGSFVAARKTDLQLNHLLGFSEEMRQQGLVPSTRIIEKSIVRPGEQVANALKISSTQQILYILRVRCANDVPTAVEAVHIPFHRFPSLEHHDLTSSLYSLLYENFGLQAGSATQSIQAGKATRRDAELLEMRPGEPVLNITRISYDMEGHPFENVISVYRGDRYVFTVTLNRE